MSSHRFSRRTMLRGLGVTMALPWLESLNVWGDEPRGQTSGQRSAGPAGRAVRRQRLSQQGMVGQGRRQADGAWARCSRPLADFREKMLFIRGLYNEQATQGEHPQLADRQSAFRRAARLGRRHPLGHEHRPVARADDTAGRPRCRAWCWAARSRTRRCTRIIRCCTARTFRGLRRRRRRRWSCIRRWRSIGCSRTRSSAATRACSMRCSPTPAICAGRSAPRDQRKLDEYLDSVRDVEQRIEQAGKQGELQGWRPTLEQAEHPAPARRHSAEHRRPHAADVRHPGARLPDGYDADHHAEAEQRSFVAALPASGRGLHDPPPAVALATRPTG